MNTKFVSADNLAANALYKSITFKILMFFWQKEIILLQAKNDDTRFCLSQEVFH